MKWHIYMFQKKKWHIYINMLRVSRDGLIIAKELGLCNLIVELDALSVVHMLSSDKPNLLMEPLLSDCRSLYRAISNKWT